MEGHPRQRAERRIEGVERLDEQAWSKRLREIRVGRIAIGEDDRIRRQTGRRSKQQDRSRKRE
jgi:hypothetical protein